MKFLILILIIGIVSCSQKSSINTTSKPNIIILFTDDMGYADIGAFGADHYLTPNLDQMAAEGMIFTDFYVPSSMCSPSRQALMTGCYPARNYVSVDKPENAIGNITPMSEIEEDEVSRADWEMIQEKLAKYPDAKFARHSWGLQDEEFTMPEMLKQVGYSTVMYGKWHLGEAMRFHPIHHGFDEYWGVSQSISVSPTNDHPYMLKNHIWFPNQPIFDNDSIIEYNTDSSLLTRKYTERAVQYIKDHTDSPFFMHFSYMMPHVPIGVPDDIKGKSGAGLYGDVIMEIDWSVGELFRALRQTGIDKNTLVIFTSDNGPWLAYGDHAGSAFPLREGKGTYFEGGVRVPCIMRWPEIIPAGTVNSNPAMTIDLFATFAEITGASVSQNKIDGKSILQMMTDHKNKSPQDAYYFFDMGNFPEYGDVLAIRADNWKLVFPHKYKTLKGQPRAAGGVPVDYKTDSIGLTLFNLSQELQERTNLAKNHPEIVNMLTSKADSFVNQLKNEQRGVIWEVKN